MKKLLLAASALALMTGAASAQSISFGGAFGSPTVSVSESAVSSPPSFGTADIMAVDENSRAANGNDVAETDRGDNPNGTDAEGSNDAGDTGDITIPENEVANSQATVQVGDGNAAGTLQYGNGNEAATLQIGEDNTSYIMQDGDGVGSSGGNPNGDNEASALQVGDLNSQIIMQLGNDNAASVLQKGDSNEAITLQQMNDNSAATVQYGEENVSFIGQSANSTSVSSDVNGQSIAAPGFTSASNSAGNGTGDNAAVALQTGNGNLSSIVQLGSTNAAFAIQVQQPAQ